MEGYAILKNRRIVKDYNHPDVAASLMIALYEKGGQGIWEVRTEEKYRRQGYAYQLLKFVLRWHPRYYLYVYPENTAAVNLYLKLGFKFQETAEDNEYHSKLMVYERDKS